MCLRACVTAGMAAGMAAGAAARGPWPAGQEAVSFALPSAASAFPRSRSATMARYDRPRTASRAIVPTYFAPHAARRAGRRHPVLAHPRAVEHGALPVRRVGAAAVLRARVHHDDRTRRHARDARGGRRGGPRVPGLVRVRREVRVRAEPEAERAHVVADRAEAHENAQHERARALARLGRRARAEPAAARRVERPAVVVRVARLLVRARHRGDRAHLRPVVKTRNHARGTRRVCGYLRPVWLHQDQQRRGAEGAATEALG